MQAGRLRALVKIQHQTGGQDSWGTPDPEVWSDVAEVWADLKHLSGSESIRAAADVSVVLASGRIRWRDDVTPAMRLTHDGNNYDIEAVLPGARREHIDLVLKLVR